MENFSSTKPFWTYFYTDAGLDVDAFEREVDNALDEYPSVVGGNVQYGQNLSQNLFHLLQEADSLREEFQDEFYQPKLYF